MDIRSVIVSIFATLAVSVGAGTLYVDVATGDDVAAAADTRRLVSFRTIQAAVDCASSGDVVKVYPGVYDDAGFTDESGQKSCVCITKGLTLEAVSSDPSETVIRGAWDASNFFGIGPNAVRCVCVTGNGDTEPAIVRGFTLERGATISGASGGGFLADTTKSAYLVNCRVIGCTSSGVGSALRSGTAVRCRIEDSYRTTVVYGTRLINSLVAGFHHEGDDVGMIRSVTAYNSTIVDSDSYAMRNSATAYNSVILYADKGLSAVNSDTLYVTNCVAAPWVNLAFTPGEDTVTTLEEDPFVSPGTGDFRPRAGSVIENRGEAEILALLQLPEGIDAFVDLAGDEIPKSGRIAAGAYQRSIDLTGYSGDIVVLSRLEVDGYRQASTKTYMHCRTPGGPRPVCLKPILTEGLELVGCSAPGVVGNALFPQMNGEIWTMTPPEGMVISNKPYYTTRIYYVNPDPEKGSDENAGTSAEAPLFTIQAALNKITDNNGAVVHCAPGVYTNGSSSSSRFCVSREYVRITGAGRDLSFVYGQKAAGTEEQEDGRGTGALRCVFAEDRHSCVQGFTLANGYTLAGDDNKSSRQGGIVYTSGDLFQVQDCTLSNGWAARGTVGYKGIYRRCLITGQDESVAVGTHFREAEAILSCLYADNTGAALDQPFFADSASYGRMICQSSLVGHTGKAAFNENYKVRNVLVGPSAKISVADVAGSLKTSSFTWSGVSQVTGGSYAGVAQGDYRLISTSSAVTYGVTPDYTWYTTDFTGKPFLPDADGKVPAGAFSEILSGTDHYVDPVNGSDTNCGRDPTAPVKTLYAAFNNVPPAAGSTVHLAAGTYGAEQPEFLSDDQTVSYRLMIPANVTVVGAGARETILDACGSAETPRRVVYVAGGAVLKGVTIRGGYHTSGTAGCYATSSSKIVNCIIVSNRLDTAERGSAFYYGSYYGCIIDHNRGYYTGYNLYRYENCTLGPDNFRVNGTTGADCARGLSGPMINTIIACPSCQTKPDYVVSNCVIRPSTSNPQIEFGCVHATLDEIALGDDYRLGKGSPAIDLCENRPSALVDTDVFGGQRVYNGVADAGAVEYDCRGEFAAVLTKGTVVAAGADVTTNGVQGLVLPDGNALKVRFENAEEKTATIRIPVKVSGDGTLTLILNGHPYASFTAADGAAECKIKNALAANDLVLSYDAGEGGEGLAEIGAALGPAGVLLIVR